MKSFLMWVSAWFCDLVVRGIEAFWYTFCIIAGLAAGCALFYPLARFFWVLFKNWAAADILNAANP